MTIILFVIGFLSIPANHKGAIWAMASMMDVWTFVYQMIVGPICFVIISEISATRLRTKTIAIGTAVQAAASIIFTVAVPYMLNSNEGNWGGKAGFLFGGKFASFGAISDCRKAVAGRTRSLTSCFRGGFRLVSSKRMTLSWSPRKRSSMASKHRLAHRQNW